MKHDRTQLLFTRHSQFIVSRRLLWWDMEKSYTRKYLRHLDFLQRFPSKTIRWKNWVREAAGGGKDSQQTQLQLLEQGDFSQSNNLVRLFWKSFFNLTAKAPMKEQGDLFSSWVPVSVERLDQDKDADENADKDLVRTGRPLFFWTTTWFVHTVRGHRHWLQGVWIATCGCETGGNFRVLELVKKIESHPHLRDLLADLQQQRLQPIHWRFESDDSWNGQCRVVRAVRNNSNFAMLRMRTFTGIKELSSARVDISWDKMNPANIFINGDWTLLNRTSSRRGDFEVLGTAKLKHRAFQSPQCSKETSQKEIWRNSLSLLKRLKISLFAA